ncbi:hypothetical protein GGR52DRAFT_350529 [Hypoxylon sp. FL1284]|nr:hypothetical protein GGR52DRAFT_350529 [Hypoxylon sp. FL1284]
MLSPFAIISFIADNLTSSTSRRITGDEQLEPPDLSCTSSVDIGRTSTPPAMAKKKVKNSAASATTAKTSQSKRIEAREKLVADWEEYFGSGDLSDWQRLMADLGFTEQFTSKNQCRKVCSFPEPHLSLRPLLTCFAPF